MVLRATVLEIPAIIQKLQNFWVTKGANKLEFSLMWVVKDIFLMHCSTSTIASLSLKLCKCI